MNAAMDLDIPTVAIYALEDHNSLHIQKADEAYLMDKSASNAYLDMEQILHYAQKYHCDLIHPGYGFLSENADFAKKCENQGLTFVVGIIANNPKYLGGAMDTNVSDKTARFIQLCSAFGIPLVSLCDTPGFMVGPGAEKTVLVRHISRIFTAVASSKVPFFTILIRKAYGLGAFAMAGGGFLEPFFKIAWPTGEFGAMGLEGQVQLDFSKELAAIEDPKEREVLYQKLLKQAYNMGKATNVAALLEIDEVIDPADTRKWIMKGLLASANRKKDNVSTRQVVDNW